LLDAVQYQHIDATSSTVLHLISNHLNMAPHRQGGAGKGYHVDQGRTVNLSAEPPPAAMAEECDVGCDDDVSSDLNDGAIDGSDDDYEDDC